jgi:hypothetical protein
MKKTKSFQIVFFSLYLIFFSSSLTLCLIVLMKKTKDLRIISLFIFLLIFSCFLFILSYIQGRTHLMGWGVPGNPKKKKKKFPLMPFEIKNLHGKPLQNYRSNPPKKFSPKISTLKCFSLKIHENSHDYPPRPAIKSKDFREIKRFKRNAKNEKVEEGEQFH